MKDGAAKMQVLVSDAVQIFSASLSSRVAHGYYISHYLVKKKVNFILNSSSKFS